MSWGKYETRTWGKNIVDYLYVSTLFPPKTILHEENKHTKCMKQKTKFKYSFRVTPNNHDNQKPMKTTHHFLAIEKKNTMSQIEVNGFHTLLTQDKHWNSSWGYQSSANPFHFEVYCIPVDFFNLNISIDHQVVIKCLIKSNFLFLVDAYPIIFNLDDL